MADFLVYNRTNPIPSAHRAGTHLASTAPDPVADVCAKYAALHPVAAGDVLEVVDAATFNVRAASATIVYSVAPAAPLPAINA